MPDAIFDDPRLAALYDPLVGVERAQASLDIARSKPGGERVRRLHGDATTSPQLQVDLATMTANVAQAIVREAGWHPTSQRAWESWNRASPYRNTEIDGVGAVGS
jgi:hypothetical protein